MYQTTVTIGRNIGTDPMRARDWTRFANSVRDALIVLSGDRTSRFTLVPVSWVNADGTTSYEDSLHLTVRHTDALSPVVTGVAVQHPCQSGKDLWAGSNRPCNGSVILVTPSKY